MSWDIILLVTVCAIFAARVLLWLLIFFAARNSTRGMAAVLILPFAAVMVWVATRITSSTFGGVLVALGVVACYFGAVAALAAAHDAAGLERGRFKPLRHLDQRTSKAGGRFGFLRTIRQLRSADPDKRARAARALGNSTFVAAVRPLAAARAREWSATVLRALDHALAAQARRLAGALETGHEGGVDQQAIARALVFADHSAGLEWYRHIADQAAGATVGWTTYGQIEPSKHLRWATEAIDDLRSTLDRYAGVLTVDQLTHLAAFADVSGTESTIDEWWPSDHPMRITDATYSYKSTVVVDASSIRASAGAELERRRRL